MNQETKQTKVKVISAIIWLCNLMNYENNATYFLKRLNLLYLQFIRLLNLVLKQYNSFSST